MTDELKLYKICEVKQQQLIAVFIERTNKKVSFIINQSINQSNTSVLRLHKIA